MKSTLVFYGVSGNVSKEFYIRRMDLTGDKVVVLFLSEALTDLLCAKEDMHGFVVLEVLSSRIRQCFKIIDDFI